MPVPLSVLRSLRRGVVLAMATALVVAMVPSARAVPEPPGDPGPVASETATPTSEPSGPAPASPVRASPDRTDRLWPKNPPWDACPRPVWPGTLSSGNPGGGRRVLVIGDSLTRESRTLTARGLRASGWTPTFRCWGSRRLDWGIDQVARSKRLDQLPSFVIMALGTNDISWETQATTERRLRTVLDRLGPRRQVLWVDLHLTRSAWLNARADWFNGLIRRLASTRPNVSVIAWHKVARASGIRGWDGIHYGPFGYRLRARTVVKALDKAGRAHPAATPRPTPIATPIPAPVPTPTVTPSPTASATQSPAVTVEPTGWPSSSGSSSSSGSPSLSASPLTSSR